MTHTTPMQAAAIHAMPHKHEANTADVTHNVREALKQRARSPFIGIACGRKTIMIRRELFKKSLAGILKRETVYGSERYGYLLNSDDRKAVKAQLAVLLGVPEVAISAFRKLETYLIKDGQQ